MDPILTPLERGLNFSDLRVFVLQMFIRKEYLYKRIFLIHGHDEINRLRLEKILKDFGIEVVVMKDIGTFGSKTLIEKFEMFGSYCNYAIALCTPDDIIVDEDNNSFQARPNVMFEIGWFCGKIGRDRVLLVSKKGTKIFSDFSGIESLNFKEDVQETAIQIYKALKRQFDL